MTTARRTATTRARPDSGEARNAIYDRILRAVLEHRLPPGTRLVEDRLAELFETSRAQVREVLARLAHEGIVTTVLNRGAFISAPTPQETRDVFEARRLIEPGLVRRLAQGPTKAKMGLLTRLVNQELQAREANDKPAIVRLSGEFHVLLAECAGNQRLVGPTRAYSTLCCLALFLYDAPLSTACRELEHAQIVKAIAERRADDAAALMVEHLNGAEAALDFTPPYEAPVDPIQVLAART